MAAPIIKHQFHSDKGDQPDSTFVRPSDWNNPHTMAVSKAAVIGALAAGPADELPIDTIATGDTGHVMSSDAIRKAIADAIAAIPAPGSIINTGDIVASMLTSKTGWLLLDGKTVGKVGSTAGFADNLSQPLFNMFHGMADWPIQNPDGTAGTKTTALADWDALKKIALPNTVGRALVGMDAAAAIIPGAQTLGALTGVKSVALTAAQQANMGVSITVSATARVSGTHDRNPGLDPTNQGNPSISFGGYPNAPQNFLTLGDVSGGAATGSGSTSGGGPTGAAHDNVQPSIAVNWFIKL